MKKVKLNELVGNKIVYTLLLVSYYWMWARTDWKNYYDTIQYTLGVFFFVYFVYQSSRIYRYKKEETDELAELNLKKCDSICLKVLVFILIITAFLAAIFGHTKIVSTEVVGWIIVLSLLFIAILRTILFNIMDKKGM